MRALEILRKNSGKFSENRGGLAKLLTYVNKLFSLGFKLLTMHLVFSLQTVILLLLLLTAAVAAVVAVVASGGLTADRIVG
jgi:hypothetical protein